MSWRGVHFRSTAALKERVDGVTESGHINQGHGPFFYGLLFAATRVLAEGLNVRRDLLAAVLKVIHSFPLVAPRNTLA